MAEASASPQELFEWLRTTAPDPDGFDAAAWLVDYNEGERPWDGLSGDLGTVKKAAGAKSAASRDTAGPVLFLLALGVLWALWGRLKTG